MEKRIREIRVELQMLIEAEPQMINASTVKYWNHYRNYIEQAKLKLTSSRMWLGKVLGELGTANPYPDSKNPESSAIEPTADVSDSQIIFPSEAVPFIKTMRKRLEELETELKVHTDRESWPIGTDTIFNFWRMRHVMKATEDLMEASMWYGMALSELR